MTRTYGRAQRGTRVIEAVPFGRWETTTFVGALRATGFTAPLTVDGPINGEVFLAWVQQHPRRVLNRRMPQLLQTLRIPLRLTRSRSKAGGKTDDVG